MKIYIESLGCARNQVDSETMVARLRAVACKTVEDPSQADVIIVNTCSFIEAAAKESIDTILALADYKRTGECRRLIVTGCLPERYRGGTAEAMPEVDVFLGTGAFDQIESAVIGAMAPGACLLPRPDGIDPQEPIHRTPFDGHAAYLKITEGCDRHCTYCIIPTLRGRQKSRSMEIVLSEARMLIKGGARELTLVGQETTAYGMDRRPTAGAQQGDGNLPDLLEALARLDESVWIRFLYGHPNSFSPSLLKVAAQYPNLCPYFDIPVQHASDKVLRRMGRDYKTDDLLRLFDSIRHALPDAALRTTILVGFPGEDESDFKQLVNFIERVRFDHLGVFAYSDADDLPSHKLTRHVAASTARRRHDAVMRLQQEISADMLLRFIDRELDILVDEGPQDGYWIGHSRYQARDVDGDILIPVKKGAGLVRVGQMVKARIVETLDYDLIAHLPD